MLVSLVDDKAFSSSSYGLGWRGSQEEGLCRRFALGFGFGLRLGNAPSACAKAAKDLFSFLHSAWHVHRSASNCASRTDFLRSLATGRAGGCAAKAARSMRHSAWHAANSASASAPTAPSVEPSPSASEAAPSVSRAWLHNVAPPRRAVSGREECRRGGACRESSGSAEAPSASVASSSPPRCPPPPRPRSAPSQKSSRKMRKAVKAP
mmetsp:Transcript_43039/g.110917  ORF Transcript_43039/g.110917 Transcript_43039/m.110917 type:complete len:208 (-) Transcript_43039:236-859(-)